MSRALELGAGPAAGRAGTRPGRGARLVRLAAVALPVVVVIGLVRFLPRLSGTTWPGVLDILQQVPLGVLALLGGVWIAGVLSHTWVQAAALPGLGHRRALLLNLSSSAVASTVPGGGPLSVVVNWRMLGSWGFSRSSFASYTTLTTLTTALAKVLLPVLAVALALAVGVSLPPVLAHLCVAVLVLGAVLVVVLVGVWAVDRLLPAPGRWGVAPALVARVRPALADLRTSCASAVRSGWRGLLAGSVGQLAAQYLLLLLCLRATGAGLAAVPVLLAFAVGRLASTVPITPAGLGVAETAISAVLVAEGASASAAVSACVLNAIVSILLEVALGVVGLAWWRLSRRTPAVVRA